MRITLKNLEDGLMGGKSDGSEIKSPTPIYSRTSKPDV